MYTVVQVRKPLTCTARILWTTPPTCCSAAWRGTLSGKQTSSRLLPSTSTWPAPTRIRAPLWGPSVANVILFTFFCGRSVLQPLHLVGTKACEPDNIKAVASNFLLARPRLTLLCKAPLSPHLPICQTCQTAGKAIFINAAALTFHLPNPNKHPGPSVDSSGQSLAYPSSNPTVLTLLTSKTSKACVFDHCRAWVGESWKDQQHQGCCAVLVQKHTLALEAVERCITLFMLLGNLHCFTADKCPPHLQVLPSLTILSVTQATPVQMFAWRQ